MQNEKLEILVKASRRPRFKAGSELSGKVNLAAIDVTEECSKEEYNFELKLQLEIPGICSNTEHDGMPEKLTIGTRVRKTMQDLQASES